VRKWGVIYGVWDLFHMGHYNALIECKKHCDFLIVCVINDKAAEEYKRKPLDNEDARCENVRVCNLADKIIIVDRKPFYDTIVDIFFVSEEYKGKKLFCVPEHRYKDIVWIPYTKGISTTKLIKERKKLDE